LAKKINWLKVAAGAYLISPFSPEDIGTGGLTVIPSAAVGTFLVLNGLNVL
jgi:hypothetical protein